MKVISIFILFLFSLSVFAQNVNLIKQANLFDQNRGYVEASGDEIDTEKDVKLPSQMPVLDGIFIAGDFKKAIFTYYDKEKRRKVSVYHSIGDKFGGAVLKEITKDYVVLVFEGKKYKLYPDTKYKMRNVKKYTSSQPAVVKQPIARKPVKKTSVARVKSKHREIGKPRIPPKIRRNFYRNASGKSRVSAVRRPSPSRKTNAHRPRVNRQTNSKGTSNPFIGGGRTHTPPSSKNRRRNNTPF